MKRESNAFMIALAIACSACGQTESPAPAAALEAASPGILAAFREPHPLAHAQEFEAQGRHEDAVAEARGDQRRSDPGGAVF